MRLRKKKGDHSAYLADRMFWMLSVLVSAYAGILALLTAFAFVSLSWTEVMKLAIYSAVPWTVYLLHKRYVLPDTQSRHVSVFLGIALLLFICLGHPQQLPGIWNVFLIYPLYLSFFHDRLLLAVWGSASSLIYAGSLLLYVDSVALSDVLAVLTLAAGSLLSAWLGFWSQNRWMDSVRQAADAKNREYAMSMLNGLVPIVERKTHTSCKEIEQMGRLIKRMLREFPEEKVYDWEVDLLSLLHYVSRIKWPDYVFEKKGNLTSYEFQIIQEHCHIGTEMFKGAPAYQQVITALLFHHERCDGTGYPAGLKGGQIPVLAQMLGIAESYLAMTTARSYREQLAPEEALERISAMAGSRYEERVVRAFTKSLELPSSPQKKAPIPSMVG
ncbi:hypothetical protein KDJ56_02245 [Brevibacillus composti]|uniref:HD-GYP domain-containing protein n=1 Tax=Brevibacillus composti TaxID=2796470 RepID=A0A7T5ELH8_9BACL|nr:HD domain-containing phosphohydrolase [Brevibacillus composti]QQE74827.1 hypothetical protein JD108_02245 [Brevibacillus composti]QUO41911.1 hypothetical protein KDJ56_02245 [Brevibacillus composti]